MNVAYYHIHLTDDPVIWSSVFIEQMKSLEDARLLENLSLIRVRAITQNDARNQMFHHLCCTYKVRFEIGFIQNRFDNDQDMMHMRNTGHVFSENITQKALWDDAQTMDKDTNILYFHSKGSTSYFSHMDPMHIKKHKAYYYWRSFLNWGVLEHWQDCVAALATHDTAGVNHQSKPFPHYCGGYWWTKASHVKRLPDPSNRDWWEKMKGQSEETANMFPRMGDEMWVCSHPETKAYDITNFPSEKCVFTDCIPKHEYEGFLK